MGKKKSSAESETIARALRAIKRMNKAAKGQVENLREQLSEPCVECGKQDDNGVLELKLAMWGSHRSNLKELRGILKRVVTDKEVTMTGPGSERCRIDQEVLKVIKASYDAEEEELLEESRKLREYEEAICKRAEDKPFCSDAVRDSIALWRKIQERESDEAVRDKVEALRVEAEGIRDEHEPWRPSLRKRGKSDE